MIDPAGNLQVREHVRRQCRIDATARVDGAGRAPVVPARAVTDPAGWFNVRLVDISGGGLGLESPLYLPRGCRLIVRATPLSGDDTCQVPFDCRVQRASMLDRTPTYYLGVSFVGDRDLHARAAVRLSSPGESAA